MLWLIHWCWKGNRICSLDSMAKNDKMSFLGFYYSSGVSICDMHQRLHSLPVSSVCVCVCSYPSHRFSSPLSSHTLSHTRDGWIGGSPHQSHRRAWSVFQPTLTHALITALLRISPGEMKPGFSAREFPAACGYLAAVMEGCSWRQPCADAFEDCEVSVQPIYIHFAKKK